VGAVVGAWRVVGWAGRGGYGVVYCVQRVDAPEAGLFALKMALRPEDERLLREAELLECLEHLHVPRLHDSGWWKPAEGVSFPFLVMDWVEGAHLYEWAERHKISFRQGMRALAQVLRALEALHAMGAVHRDVKGSNVLVTEEGHAVLTDLGLGTYRGASVLTRQAEPLGTPLYLSPQGMLHREKHRLRARPRYEPDPADDVYAAGVMAWRLVTGTYPPDRMGPKAGEQKASEGRGSPENLVGMPREFAALIRRMLSHEPAARGRAGELAQALEEAAEKAGPEADRPIPRPTAGKALVGSPQPVRERPAWVWGLGWVGVAAAVLTVVLTPWQPLHRQPLVEEEPDAGTAGAAEAVLATRHEAEPPPRPERQGIRLDLPKKPLPGQRRPPCSTRETEINGGCWGLLANMEPPCGPRIYAWKKGCYLPIFEPPRPPTSDPP
jgi:tRNA A-37 threonylcarbamoyl transferase component Bud32